ncbi:hypothetical protein GF389_02985 [Candidatus Dojkabacteria bacterium]|nr:hypothetical protein [Candidatus Dojkabacteria bacterium]
MSTTFIWLTSTFVIGLILWLSVILIQYITRGELKFFRFKYSKTSYFIMMSPFVLSKLLDSLLLNDFKPFFIFIVFGVAGVIGETVFSIWWDTPFKKRFWVYLEEEVLKSYTSLLNFIPWSVGGYLFINIYKTLENFITIDIHTDLSGQRIIFFVPMIIVGSITMFLSFVYAFYSRKRRKFYFEFKEVNAISYFVFISPLFTALIFAISFYGIEYLILASLFGIIAFIAEYMFGKMSVLFISKKSGTILTILLTINIQPL